MSVLLFSTYITLLTLLAASGYALLLSAYKREVDQRWVLGELIIGVTTSFASLAITATTDISDAGVAESALLFLQVLMFAIIIFTFFSIRSPQWSQDGSVLMKVRISGGALFILAVINWGLVIWLL